ncbi:MAG: phosphate ABC transporter substrate-binding protein [Bacteroidetes bacterium GWE2_29_8]|nr:MAG: phosphate ABC transporter substrate-binding protein [Bacteroidetes bacterium GWE2_29_8]OFY23194.1 MAG: phosphate ABC transporter substrate-binding protein [Bacteroidetes bacterium GWF2_29_10]
MVLTSIGCGSKKQQESLKIKGSDTCLPLTQKAAENYMKKNKEASIMVTGGGSGVGLAALLDGTTDVAMASRKMKMDEILQLKKTGNSEYKEITIANDAIAVIVNPSNKISKLTREQIEDIYTGKIDNWKDLGGDDIKIIAYSRESSSGTYEFFKEHVLNKKNFGPSMLLMPATGAIVQSVSQTEGAIGYVGVAYIENSIKALLISYDNGQSYIEPTIENAKSKLYPISRPLYYYYLTKSESLVKPFVDYLLSEEGQKIVVSEGYVPVK